MVTIHHLKGKLTARRVIAPSDKLRAQSNLRVAPSATFTCGEQQFDMIESPPSELTAWTLDLIATGESAAIIPTDFTMPAAAFFDMDATVIAEESLVEIAKIAGKSAIIESLTARAMAGGMDFRESLTLRLQELKGMRRDDVISIIPTINKGMREVSSWAAQSGIPMYLISGGFVELAQPLARELGFRDFHANRFAWDSQGNMLGHADGDIIDAEAKKFSVLSWCRHLGTAPSQCMVVGDGANDLPMLNAAGWSVGFGPKPKLWPNLHCVNQTGDHKFIIHCLS